MGKGVLITGASDRIGKDVALFLARQGYFIAIHANTSKVKAFALKSEIIASGGKCEVFIADFNNEQETINLIKNVRAVWDINVLINNASVFYETGFPGQSYAEFNHIFNVNFRAPYILTKEFSLCASGGLVINLLDTKVSKNETNHFDYLLAKKSLSVFTEMAAFHLGLKIRVNAIAPGLILPPQGKSFEYLDERARQIPLKRRGSPEDIVNCVKYLLENDFITGQTIYVDGGEHL